jgi:hypothetical protein
MNPKKTAETESPFLQAKQTQTHVAFVFEFGKERDVPVKTDPKRKSKFEKFQTT